MHQQTILNHYDIKLSYIFRLYCYAMKMKIKRLISPVQVCHSRTPPGFAKEHSRTPSSSVSSTSCFTATRLVSFATLIFLASSGLGARNPGGAALFFFWGVACKAMLPKNVVSNFCWEDKLSNTSGPNMMSTNSTDEPVLKTPFLHRASKTSTTLWPQDHESFCPAHRPHDTWQLESISKSPNQCCRRCICKDFEASIISLQYKPSNVTKEEVATESPLLPTRRAQWSVVSTILRTMAKRNWWYKEEKIDGQIFTIESIPKSLQANTKDNQLQPHLPRLGLKTFWILLPRATAPRRSYKRYKRLVQKSENTRAMQD